MCHLVNDLGSHPVGSNRHPSLQVESENDENDQIEGKKGERNSQCPVDPGVT